MKAVAPIVPANSKLVPAMFTRAHPRAAWRFPLAVAGAVLQRQPAVAEHAAAGRATAPRGRP